MTKTGGRTTHRTHRLSPLRITAVTALLAVTAGTVAACGSSSDTSGAASPNRPTVQGTPPSSLLPSALLSSASALASAASVRASAFESSVSAEVSRANASASAALAGVTGTGNAISDVTLTGVPTAQSGGRRAAVVTITNSTAAAASYAVQVEFVDSSGTVVDSTVVGAVDLQPGAKASPVAFGGRDEGLAATPRVAKAQRY
ncbi:hypothetical protein [Kitasatospora sp. NPDC057015]|uniref:hypothetical protein n=1 Tax=Kitasatospora sp. NPDC057015 TaxID=3346001 RepID=UPI0036369DE3